MKNVLLCCLSFVIAGCAQTAKTENTPITNQSSAQPPVRPVEWRVDADRFSNERLMVAHCPLCDAVVAAKKEFCSGGGAHQVQWVQGRCADCGGKGTRDCPDCTNYPGKCPGCQGKPPAYGCVVCRSIGRCPTCKGRPKELKLICTTCGGRGTVG